MPARPPTARGDRRHATSVDCQSDARIRGLRRARPTAGSGSPRTGRDRACAARTPGPKVGPHETAQARAPRPAYRGQGDEDGAKEELTMAKAKFDASELSSTSARGALGGPGAAHLSSPTSSTRRSSSRPSARRSGAAARVATGCRGADRGRGAGGYQADRRRALRRLPVARLRARGRRGDPEGAGQHDTLAPDARIGIHTGGAFHKGDDDYAGQGVHVAARIGAFAQGGGSSQAARASLAERVPTLWPRAEARGLRRRGRAVAVDWR